MTEIFEETQSYAILCKWCCKRNREPSQSAISCLLICCWPRSTDNASSQGSLHVGRWKIKVRPTAVSFARPRSIASTGVFQHRRSPVGAIHNYVPVGVLQRWTPRNTPTGITMAVRKNGRCHNYWPSSILWPYNNNNNNNNMFVDILLLLLLLNEYTNVIKM